MSNPEVGIVGGGLAGCAAAYLLAEKPINTTVFERGQPGKDKACGDALLPQAFDTLSLIGIDEERIQSMGGYRCNIIDLYIYDTLINQTQFEDNASWVIPRAVIDQEIRNIVARYTSFQYETFVSDLTIKPSGKLELSLKHKSGKSEIYICDAVILATGSMNMLSKKIGIHGWPNRAYAISVYAEMQQSKALLFQFIHSCEPGYRWIFPISEKISNVGVCVLNEKPKSNLRLLGEELLKDHNAKPLGRWRSGWEPIWSGIGQNWHHPSGIVSCGDAAGLINPYCGEGITAALLSGKRAGEAISDYLIEGSDSTKLTEYSDWISSHFSREYSMNLLWQMWNDLSGFNR